VAQGKALRAGAQDFLPGGIIAEKQRCVAACRAMQLQPLTLAQGVKAEVKGAAVSGL
jgi:hypothetical protein